MQYARSWGLVCPWSATGLLFAATGPWTWAWSLRRWLLMRCRVLQVLRVIRVRSIDAVSRCGKSHKDVPMVVSNPYLWVLSRYQGTGNSAAAAVLAAFTHYSLHCRITI